MMSEESNEKLDAPEESPSAATAAEGDFSTPEHQPEALHEEADKAIDIEKLEAVRGLQLPDFSFAPSSMEAQSTFHEMTELVEEIAEDMVGLTQRMQTIEQNQTHILAQLGHIEQVLLENNRALAKKVTSLHRDLLGDRKALHARKVFDEVIPRLETLRIMRKALKSNKYNKRVRRQLESIENVLLTVLQGLGFEEFHAEEGEPFDPVNMECVGYMKGDPLVVLKADHSGYRMQNSVVRPAGVWIADPRQIDPKHSPTGDLS